MLTTKITIQQSNKIVKYIEQAIDEGNGEVIVVVRKGKIYNIRRGLDDFEDKDSENDE